MKWDYSTRRVPALGLAVALFASLLMTTALFAKPAAAMTTATQVASGGRTTCAVMSGGAAYCWGDNTYGQLGDGTTTSSATPVLVAGGYTWASISTQDDTWPGDNVATTCGVTSAGVGYCWGANTYGADGDGTTTQRTVPTLVSGAHTWASISVGISHVCGVTTAGAGYCWGYGGQDELGDNSVSQQNTPTAVSGGYTWASISAGEGLSCGVTTANVGYCWGFGAYGQLGNGITAQEATPTAVSGSYSWASISTGGANSCGVTTAGAGYCWGQNGGGQVGNNTQTEEDSPVAVSGSYVWSHISVGKDTSCGITTADVAYCWGSNGIGEVGNGTSSGAVMVPAAVTGGQSFLSISTGSDVTYGTNCGLALDGIIYCWGYNDDSQVGDGTTTNYAQPTEASLLYSSNDTTTVTVTIKPDFVFTVANQSSACNGESNFVSGAGTSSTVTFGHLAGGANASGGQALSVSGNAGGGFTVYVAGTQASQDLRSPSHNWTDVSGTYASPALLGAGEKFGYTYKDSTSFSSVTNPASAHFIALTNAATNVVMGSSTSQTGSGCVSYDAQTSATTPAGSYSATIAYTAVPAF